MMSKPAAEEASPALLRQALEQKRARKALSFAKLLMKVNPDESTVKLIVQAHELRIAELRAEGHIKEAEEMYAAVLASRPAWKNLFTFNTHAAANKPEAAAAALPPPDKLEAWIRGEMLDPRILKGLPQDNPIAVEAALICAAGDAIAAGDDATAKDKLAAIGRRSPFVDWRLFLQAQMGYYADDSKTLEDNLGRIAPGSPLIKLAAELRLLAAGKSAQPQLEIAASAGHELLGECQKLDGFFRAREQKAFLSATQRLHGSLRRQGRQGLANEIAGAYAVAAYAPELDDDVESGEIANDLIDWMNDHGGWSWCLAYNSMIDEKNNDSLDSYELEAAIRACSSPIGRSLLHLRLAGDEEPDLDDFDSMLALFQNRVRAMMAGEEVEDQKIPQKLSRDQEKALEAALREWPGNAEAWEMLIARSSSPVLAIRRYAATAPNDLKLQERLIRRAFELNQPECGEAMIAELRQRAAPREFKRLVDALFIPRIKAAKGKPAEIKRIAAEIGPDAPLEARRIALLLRWKNESARTEKIRLGKLLAEEKAPLSLKYALELVLDEKLSSPPAALKEQLADEELVLENLVQILEDDPDSKILLDLYPYINKICAQIPLDFPRRLALARRIFKGRDRSHSLRDLASRIIHTCYQSRDAEVSRQTLLLNLELGFEMLRKPVYNFTAAEMRRIESALFLLFRAAEWFLIQESIADYDKQLAELYRQHGLDRRRLVTAIKPVFCHWAEDRVKLSRNPMLKYVISMDLDHLKLDSFRLPESKA